jgi:hypothetical protein
MYWLCVYTPHFAFLNPYQWVEKQHSRAAAIDRAMFQPWQGKSVAVYNEETGECVYAREL